MRCALYCWQDSLNHMSAKNHSQIPLRDNTPPVPSCSRYTPVNFEVLGGDRQRDWGPPISRLPGGGKRRLVVIVVTGERRAAMRAPTPSPPAQWTSKSARSFTTPVDTGFQTILWTARLVAGCLAVIGTWPVRDPERRS